MDLLRPRVDRLVVSIYVNPTQFGPDEDLDTYPADLDGDLALCKAHGVDAVFNPPTLYPPGFATQVEVSGLTNGLCGARRPGHFRGVTTVVARLFGVTQCSEAAFGEKDFQQLMVVRRMTADLALPVRIVPGALIRDDDGLALSSRNTYLSAEQRRRALSLHRVLFDLAASDEPDVATQLRVARQRIDADRVDYLSIVDAETLQPVERVTRPARALVAAFYGATRLIDNVAVGPELRWT